MDTPIGYTCVCSKLEPKEDKRSRRKEGSRGAKAQAKDWPNTLIDQ